MADMTPDFNKYYNQPSRHLFRWVDFDKIRTVKRYFNTARSLTLVDLGCGTGRVTSCLVGANKVIGVDSEPALLAAAGQRGLETVIGGFENIPVDASALDGLIMIDSIEHIQSREKLLAELRRTLKSGAHFLAVTPNYGSLLWNSGEFVANKITGNKNSGHITPFTKESLSHFLSQLCDTFEIGTLNFGMWISGYGRVR